jgi:hypothetical protein
MHNMHVCTCGYAACTYVTCMYIYAEMHVYTCIPKSNFTWISMLTLAALSVYLSLSLSPPPPFLSPSQWPIKWLQPFQAALLLHLIILKGAPSSKLRPALVVPLCRLSDFFLDCLGQCTECDTKGTGVSWVRCSPNWCATTGDCTRARTFCAMVIALEAGSA